MGFGSTSSDEIVVGSIDSEDCEISSSGSITVSSVSNFAVSGALSPLLVSRIFLMCSENSLFLLFAGINFKSLENLLFTSNRPFLSNNENSTTGSSLRR